MNLQTISTLAEIESIPFDSHNFEAAIDKAREHSRQEANKSDNEIISDYSLNLLESEKVPKTDDSPKYDYTYSDKGYQFPVIKCKLLGMVMNGNLF